MKLPLLLRLLGWRVVDTNVSIDQHLEVRPFWDATRERYVVIARLSGETLRKVFPL